MTRYKKIVKETKDKSYSEIIPEIYEPSSLEAIREATKNYSVKLVAYEEEAKKYQTTYTFSEELQKLIKNDEIVIFNVCEDGIKCYEVDILNICEFITVTLGKRIYKYSIL